MALSSVAAFGGPEDDAPLLQDFGAQKNIPVKFQRSAPRDSDRIDLLFRVMQNAPLETAYVRALRKLPKDLELEATAIANEHQSFTEILDIAIIRRFQLDLSWDAEGTVNQVTLRVPTFVETHEEINPTLLRPENIPSQMHVSAVRWKKGVGIEYFLSTTPWIPATPGIQKAEMAVQRELQERGIQFGKVVPPSQGSLKFSVPFAKGTDKLATFSFIGKTEMVDFRDSLDALQQQQPVRYVGAQPAPKFFEGKCHKEVLSKGVMQGWGPGGNGTP